jgi:transcriptional regulator with XRE-family HTH domain
VEKSIYTDEYRVLLDLLTKYRQASGLTQVELAKELGQSQSFISKVERGDRRLDVIQLRTICQTLGVSFPKFIRELEQGLGGQK